MKATWYEIRVRGWLDPSWSEWFDGMEIRHESDGETILSGRLPDQAALHGCIAKIRNLNVQLLSITSGTPRHNTRSV